MRILTWNINSVRLRIDLLKRVIKECDPDVICLQETKTPDEHFPLMDVVGAGYPHTHIHGMKSYNGVAILSKIPFDTTEIYHRVGKEDCRHVAVKLDVGSFSKPLEIHCLYIPAGGDEPDPAINDKFAHKLGFVDEMTGWFKANYKPDDPLVVLGDFNIAPLEHDVWSHKQLLKVVSHTPIEVEKLAKMQKSLAWHDAIRHFVPEEEKSYSWWSYRNRDWKKSSRGRRLDHIWVTGPLVSYLKSHDILTEARDWDKPSDHVPVMIDLDVF
ncbi:MAG: exodeoxyribonuclease III [Rhodospirillales bacterium]|nr:exodeoxyribonuclease III [Rhodospirillales bacterium]